jgi:hypothetical protein
MTLVFCKQCNEAVADGWTYNDAGYHPKHPAPVGPPDPPAAGRCQWGSGHFAAAIWALPKDGKYYCIDHLTRIVRIGSWGTK